MTLDDLLLLYPGIPTILAWDYEPGYHNDNGWKDARDALLAGATHEEFMSDCIQDCLERIGGDRGRKMAAELDHDDFRKYAAARLGMM